MAMDKRMATQSYNNIMKDYAKKLQKASVFFEGNDNFVKLCGLVENGTKCDFDGIKENRTLINKMLENFDRQMDIKNGLMEKISFKDLAQEEVLAKGGKVRDFTMEKQTEKQPKTLNMEKGAMNR